MCTRASKSAMDIKIKHNKRWMFTLIFIIILSFGCTRENLASSRQQVVTSQEQSFTLKTGVYSLEGYNAGSGSVDYKGEVYGIEWRIEPLQTQIGVGILSDSILSVGYLDASGQDLGVVSYRLLGEGKLDGKWASIEGRQTGREVLTWKSE